MATIEECKQFKKAIDEAEKRILKKLKQRMKDLSKDKDLRDQTEADIAKKFK